MYTVEDLRGRYDARTWADFENFARNQDIQEGVTVWEWLKGKSVSPKPDFGAVPSGDLNSPSNHPPSRKNPVSQSLETHGAGILESAIIRALKAVDFVHDDGDLPTIQASVNPRLKTTLAQYVHRGSIAIGIEFKPQSEASAAFSALEEIGHFIDHQVLGTAGHGFASESPDFEGWRRVVDKTKAVKALKRSLSSASGPLKVNLTNAARPREIFARSYAQYIAIKSGDPVLQAGLEADRKTVLGALINWKNEDFESIINYFNILFKKKGWL